VLFQTENMNKANVNLSEKEQILVTNTDWILTKHQVIKKVYDLFGMLSENHKAFVSTIKDLLPTQITSISPKIYKGEQYLLLPYVMMDYPRYYKTNETFAIRHFFWWGNYFSIAFHLSGSYKSSHEEKIINNYTSLSKNGWFIGINNNPWQHHFNQDNYVEISTLSYKDWNTFIKTHPFIKLAKKIPLSEWEHSYQFFTENFFFLINLIR